MGTLVKLTVDGLEIETFKNDYDIWFFNKGDRVRETFPRDEDGHVSEDEFIGYRAKGALIQRRMILAGYDIEACKAHFLKYRDEIVVLLEDFFSRTASVAPEDITKESPVGECWKYYLAAVRNSDFEDWISLFPEALELKKQQREAGYNFYSDPPLTLLSPEPLINAMLSYFDFYSEYVLTGPMNFPCNDSNHFVTALLASYPGNAIFELNIEPLIRSGYADDFTDLEELQKRETLPHAVSRKSIEEITNLSAIQADNPSLQRMCYASIITAMEAYLGDILRREIFSRHAVKERFVASYEPFTKMKLPLADLYKRLLVIDDEIRNVLDGLSLHKIDVAKNIFWQTLLIEFPLDSLPFIGAAVNLRHDIVHRNGRDTKGAVLSIDRQAVNELSEVVLNFIRAIDMQVLDGLLQENEFDVSLTIQ